MDKLKMVFRVAHLTSTGFLSGSIILNYFFSTNKFLADDSTFIEFANPLAGIVALLSGIVNFLMLRPRDLATAPEKKEKKKKVG